MPPDLFSEDERTTYLEWIEKRSRASLSPALSTKMYELFLRGDTCERIVHLSPGIQLGQVLEARIRDKWDERRTKYVDNLLNTVGNRLRQTQLEAIEFATDLMAVAHHEFGDKLKKYLMSRDPADLPPNSISSLAAYSKVADTLLKLSGQTGGPQKDRAPIVPLAPVNHGVIEVVSANKTIGAGTNTVDSTTANRILQFLESQSQEDDE